MIQPGERVPRRHRRWLLPFCAVALLALSGLIRAAEGQHPITGRVYAGTMGVAGAPWLDRPEREAEEHPERAVQLLPLRVGMTVADVGAGSGYYTELLSSRVGPKGRVIAEDIQPGMIALIEQRAAKKKLSNVTARLGTQTDPKLEPASCDLALMVDVYHEFSEPQKMLQSVRRALKPEGRLVLLEYRKEDDSVPIRPEHKMSVAEAKAEVEAEGFVLETVKTELPWQHVLIFTLKR